MRSIETIGKAADRWYSMGMNMSNDEADVFVFDEVTSWGVSAQDFAKDFQELLASKPKRINLHINSPGGNVSDGVAIHNTIKRATMPVESFIEGWAASIATVIALAGDPVNMSANSMFMIHDPSGFVLGGAEEMRKTAKILDAVKQTILNTYVSKTGKEREELSQKMTDETWFTAQEAVGFGFADAITDEVELVARFDPSKFEYKNMPARCALVGPGGMFDRIEPNGERNPNEEETTMAVESAGDLRKAHPELVKEIEDDAKNTLRADANASAQSAVEAAVDAERARVKDILAFAEPGQEDLAQELIDKATPALDAAKELKAAHKGGLEERLKRQKDADDAHMNYGGGPGGGDDPDDPGTEAPPKTRVAAADRFKSLVKKIMNRDSVTKAQATDTAVDEEPDLHEMAFTTPGGES